MQQRNAALQVTELESKGAGVLVTSLDLFLTHSSLHPAHVKLVAELALNANLRTQIPYSYQGVPQVVL